MVRRQSTLSCVVQETGHVISLARLVEESSPVRGGSRPMRPEGPEGSPRTHDGEQSLELPLAPSHKNPERVIRDLNTCEPERSRSDGVCSNLMKILVCSKRLDCRKPFRGPVSPIPLHKREGTSVSLPLKVLGELRSDRLSSPANCRRPPIYPKEGMLLLEVGPENANEEDTTSKHPDHQRTLGMTDRPM